MMAQYVNNISSNLRLGGGAGTSTMHPVVLALLLITIVLVFVLPWKYVLLPVLLIIFLTPFGEQLYVAGLHLPVGRILTLCGLVRVGWMKMQSGKELISGGFTPIDKAFAFWAMFRAAATVLEFLSKDAVVNQCAFLIDSLGGFVLLRFLIRDEEDIARTLKTLAFIVAILALVMTNEKVRDLNVFGYIGGRLTPYFRDGAIRSQGSLSGPIPAGTLGATLLCLFVWLWQSGKSRVLGVAGVVGSVVMVGTSASSTPFLALLGDMLAFMFWPLRKNMRAVRWGIVLLLLSLQLVMKAPVWMVINHVDLVAGNSGYHRAALIDQCIRHFSDWWLIGVKSTASWGWDMWDQANQFVTEAENGGLVTFICFVLLVSRSLGRLGTARRLVAGNRKKQWSFWLLGSVIFSYIVSFFGIEFTDQSQFAWFAVLAIICVATGPTLHAEKARARQQVSMGFGLPLSEPVVSAVRAEY